MGTITTLVFFKYVGVGVLLIPSLMVSKATLTKAKKIFINDGFFYGILLLVCHITFCLAPVGILLAVYLDEGLKALLIVSFTSLLIKLGMYVYENIIQRTFIIRIEKELLFALYRQSEEEGVTVKQLVKKRIFKR
ncbi:hypothetical protein [Pectobacterium polaris]|uniref:hypothetical protein n=1 Tax=Pectobacterium polaris TaxID=2042057 RepID=UPI0015834BD9|nr:hypothetical protein [Pectobacterium polaris]